MRKGGMQGGASEQRQTRKGVGEAVSVAAQRKLNLSHTCPHIPPLKLFTLAWGSAIGCIHRLLLLCSWRRHRERRTKRVGGRGHRRLLLLLHVGGWGGTLPSGVPGVHRSGRSPVPCGRHRCPGVPCGGLLLDLRRVSPCCCMGVAAAAHPRLRSIASSRRRRGRREGGDKRVGGRLLRGRCCCCGRGGGRGGRGGHEERRL